MTRSRITAALLALSATATLAAGCGSDSNSSSSDSGGGSSTETKTGGTLIAQTTSFPDYLDPALSYTADGWDTLWAVYTPLLTYKHAEGKDGSEIVPGLAQDLPTISDDGLTYTLKLREGLKYSDGSPVKASDFEHSIKRVLNQSSGGSSFYTGIEGAEEYVKAGKANADIPGITGDDATGEITVKLAEKDPQFTFKLAMDFAGLVPSNTPFQNETKKPPPGAGPFMLDDVVSGQKWSLVRNPNFQETDNVPAAKADRINYEVVKNQRRQAADVVANKIDFVYDPAGPDVSSVLRTQAKGRYSEHVTNSVYYESINNSIAPFNNADARKALNFAVDKGAIARLYGGLLQPTCNFLPPGMVGYVKVDPCPYGEPGSKPDLAKAKQLVQQSGTAGTEITVWGDDEDPSTPVTNYFADVLNSIGYKAKVKIVDASEYFQTIQNQSTKAQVMFNDWFQDFPHPANFLFLVDGGTIQKTGNLNPGMIQDDEMDAMIAKANSADDPADVVDQYGAIDKRLADNAYQVTYGNRKLAMASSARVNFDGIVWHPVYDADVTTIGLK